MCKKKIILACDERGSIYRMSKSHSWVYGGFVFEIKNRMKLSKKWMDIKTTICKSSELELKWMHFFCADSSNPLKKEFNSKNTIYWILEELFKESLIITPISIRIPKDRAHGINYRISKKGNKVLDIDLLIFALYGQFASLLGIIDSFGEMWFDSLGSITEEKRRKNEWIELWESSDNKLLKKINKDLFFFNSKQEPIIQIADFISGVIWAASEGEDEFLLQNLKKYFPFWWSKLNLITIV